MTSPAGFRTSLQQLQAWRRRAGTGRDGAQAAFRLPVGATPGDVRTMLAVVAARHEIFRSVLKDVAGLPLQVLDAAPALHWSAAPSPDHGHGAALSAAWLHVDGEPALWLGLDGTHGDAATLAIVMQELYGQLQGRRTAGDPVQYADYAQWQFELAPSDEHVAAQAFWRAQVLAPTGRLPLEQGSDRSPWQRGEVCVAEACEVSEPDVFAAWGLLLARHVGQPAFMLGLVQDGRSDEVADACGPYARVLPLGLRVDLQAPWSDWTHTLAALREDASAHADHLPDLEPAPDLQYGVYPALPQALWCEAVEAPFRLKLEVCRPQAGAGSGLRVRLAYDSSRFDAQAAHELAAQLRWLMAAPPAGTEPLRRISLLSGTARDFLKGGLAAASDAALADVPLLHEAIEAQARLTPDAIAVAGDGQMLSYAELDRRAQALALRLVAAGAGPDRIVAVCMERSVDLVVALLGVLKAGAAYLPLDPTYPPQRLAYMVDDSAAGWLVAHEATRSRVPAVQHVLWIEGSASTSAAEPAALVRPHPDQLAYVIYTSGSTGRPKGVAITHRNAAHSTLARDRWYERTVRGYLLLSSVAFDSSVAGIFWTLAQGGRLVLPGEHEYRDVPALARLAALHQVTHLLALPSLHAQLLDQAGQLASLTDVIVAGEACLPALVQAHAQALPQAQLFNEYGPTECTVWSIAHRTQPGEEPVPIGAPVPFIRAFVLDDDLQPLPAGLPGELYLAGPALARGYLGRPDLTAERFVPHPQARGGERLYRTGDLVRWRLQGTDPRIDFLGRVDQQVKIRGFRIELGEIEARLLEHAAVREAVAIVREDTAGERRIVAYVVPGGPPPQADLLRQHLLRSLPEHLLPTAFVVLQALPLTPNGKVDRNALPAPEAGGAADYVAPRSATESLLAAIWADVLNVPRVGIHDNFFELGGHSLVATQVMSRVRRSFRAELPVRELFAAPTVSGLAQVVERVRHGGAVVDSPIEPLPRGADTTLPLSFAQQRLWFLAQLDPQDVSYHIPCLVRLAGRLDVAALQQAFDALQRRHEVLRTAFPADAQGRPMQRVVAEPVARLLVVDLAAHAQPQAEAARLALRDAMEPFSLADGPLLRATLLRLDGDLHHLVLVLHHIVSDGWSTERLLDDLGRLYAQACAGGPVALETLVLQYADYAAWQRSHLTDAVLASELAHWQQVLGEEQPLLALPTDRPRPPQLSGRGARLHVRLPEPLSQAARKFAQRHNASLFMLLETLFAALLARHAGQQDIRIGTLVAARQRIELEPLVGLFVNTVVLRHDFSRAPDLHTLLDATRTAVLDAHQHHELPFERLVDRLAPGRDLSHAPLFQAMFDMQTERYAALASLPGLRGELSAIDVPTAKFDLSLTVAEQGGSIHAGFEYSTDLFDAGTVERLAAHYERLLSAALAAPKVPLQDLPLLTAAEAACLCAAPAQALPQGAGPAPDFASLWQQSARRFAAALAVQDDHGALSYGELAHRAEALAARLAAAGAGADAPVAILLPRCNDYLVAIVASFLAGAAYLPLDPSLPVARLAHMLELAAPAVLVSDTPLGAELCRAAAVAPRLVSPTAAAGEPSNAGAAPAPRPAHPDQLAYVIFTSGSTGTPKGAMVTQAGMMNNLLGKIGQLALTPDDRIAQTASPCFDISVWQFLTALLCGASVHILPDRVVRDPAALLTAVNEARISVLESVPSLMRGMLADPDAPRRLPSLRWLLPTGEALPVELARQWLARFPGVPLLNAYGPAECADDVALWRIDTPPAAGLVHLPIGRPAANLRLHVLNDAMQLQPPGVPGELAIGGIGVGRGYLGDAALTAERFVPDPFGPPGSRLYRSGDRVCTDTEGVLTFLGRCDHQVKIRGYRVEPGEVEVRLLQCPGVQAAAVLAHGEPVRLVAYVSGAVTDPQAVRRFVADALPEYMVPAAVVVLPELPLNANGKLDRARLPAPDFSLPAAAAARPRNDIEATLAQVWMQVLGLRDVGIHDNFFALGGDSILTIQVVSRAREAGLKLSARLLFLHPTIESLAAVATPAESAVPQGAARGDVPLTPIQRWFFDQPWPNPHHWNQSVLLTPRAALDPAWVRATLSALVAHHDASRLRFEPGVGAGSWRQYHADTESADLLEVHDVAEADQVLPVCDAVQASLDINRGPLLRGALLRLPDASQRLLIAVHHLVVDGVSWRILLEDFSTVHGQLARGEAITLPARGASFQDWALELQARAQAGEFDAELDFWRSQDAAPLPVRHPAGARVEGRARLVSARLDRAATGQLLQCARWHARPDDFLLTALAQVLLQWSGQGAVVVEQESHGRPDELRGGADVGRTVGWFTAAYPVRLAPDLRAAPVVQLRQVKQALREVPRQGLGYGVLRHLQRRLDAPAMPVSFNYLGQLDATVEGSLFAHLDTRSGRLYDAAAPRAFEFDLNSYVQGGCLQLDWTYGTDRYPQAEIEALAQRFIARLVALLEAAAAAGTDLLTPQDFPGTGLDADALEQLLGEMD